VTEDVALEVIQTLGVGGKIFLARMTCCLDDMLWVECACLYVSVGLGALDSHSPQPLSLIPRSGFKRCLDPDVELEELGISLEELSELVFGCEDRPVRRKVDVWHVIIPDGIMKDELVVSSSPVVTNSVLAINQKCLDTQVLQTCTHS
jgi:hypothetical protein